MNWIGWIIYAVAQVINILTAPKQPKETDRPPDLKDFNAPTAEEGRAIPVIFGRQKVDGSNVVWWGDLDTVEISSVWYYQAGIHQIYCMSPIDRITAIWDGDTKIAVDYTINTISDDLVSRESYYGDLYILFGEPNQEVNEYFENYADNTAETDNPMYDKAGYIPAFRNVFSTIFQGKLVVEDSLTIYPTVGTSPTPNSLSAELTRTQRQSDFSEQWLVSKAEIGSYGSMNVVHAIREAITSKDWGMGKEDAKMGTSFEQYAVLAYNEGFGVSCTLDRASMEMSDFIGKLCEYVDGFVYPDNNGLYQLKLVRDNYDSDGLEIYDESDYVAVKSFTRGTQFQMTNQIAITYTDPVEWKKVTTYAHDLAAIQKQGAVITSSINYEWITDKELATKIAARELRKATSQLAKCTIEANRSMSVLFPGDVFKLRNADLGLVDIIFRVVKIDKGKFDDGRVEVICVEDIFALGQGLYAPPNTTDYDAALGDPFASEHYLIDEIPYFIAENEYPDISPPTTDSSLIMTLQSKPIPELINYQQWVGASGSLVQYEDGNFAYYNRLQNSLGYTQVSDVALDLQVDDDYASLTDVYAIIQDVSTGSYEIILVVSFNQTSKTMTIKRGIFDTVPQFHPAGSVVWFSSITASRGVIETEEFTSGTKYFQLLNQTALGGVLPGDTPEIAKTLVKRFMLPYRPKCFEVESEPINDSGYGLIDTNGLTDITFTWVHATRLETTIIYDSFEDTSESPEASQEYEVKLYYPDGTLIRTLTGGITGETTAYTEANRTTDFGANLFFDMIVTIQTLRSTYSGLQLWTYKMMQYDSTDELDYDISVNTIRVFMSGFSAESLENMNLGLGFKVIKFEYTTNGNEPGDPTAVSPIWLNQYTTKVFPLVPGGILTYITGALIDAPDKWVKATLYHPSVGMIGTPLNIIRLIPVSTSYHSVGNLFVLRLTIQGYFNDSMYYTYGFSSPADPTDGDALYTGNAQLVIGYSPVYFKVKGIKGGFETQVLSFTLTT